MSSHAFFRLVPFSQFSACFQTLPLSVVRLLLRSIVFGLTLSFPILVCRIVPRVAWSLCLARLWLQLSVAFPVSVCRIELSSSVPCVWLCMWLSFSCFARTHLASVGSALCVAFLGLPICSCWLFRSLLFSMHGHACPSHLLWFMCLSMLQSVVYLP